MQNDVDIMLDIETLGVSPGCVVLSIGAVPFDLRDRSKTHWRHGVFHSRISVESCEAVGLVKEYGSMRFWDSQPEAVRAEAFRGDFALREALETFSKWFLGLAPDPDTVTVWCQGANFDIPILAAAYRACDMYVPWHYRAPRDTRTLYDLADFEPARTHAHDALEDCQEQVRNVLAAAERLGITHKMEAA